MIYSLVPYTGCEPIPSESSLKAEIPPRTEKPMHTPHQPHTRKRTPPQYMPSQASRQSHCKVQTTMTTQKHAKQRNAHFTTHRNAGRVEKGFSTVRWWSFTILFHVKKGCRENHRRLDLLEASHTDHYHIERPKTRQAFQINPDWYTKETAIQNPLLKGKYSHGWLNSPYEVQKNTKGKKLKREVDWFRYWGNIYAKIEAFRNAEHERILPYWKWYWSTLCKTS
jgi:hypothetical protein